MSNQIKNIQIDFENCEGISIPYNCFKNLTFKLDETKKDENCDGHIINMECTIIDNGNITYSTTWSSNRTSPIERLNQYEDICWFDILYSDDTKKSYYVDWYYESDYANPQENKNQTNQLMDYKTIHIKVEPYEQKYTVSEIFDFDEGTKFKDEDNNLYYIYKGIFMKIDEKGDVPVYITKDIVNKDYALQV